MHGGFPFLLLWYGLPNRQSSKRSHIICLQVIRYDDGPFAVIDDATNLEAYIAQNANEDIQRRRYVRMALRALEGRIVLWPYEHIEVLLVKRLNSHDLQISPARWSTHPLVLW